MLRPLLLGLALLAPLPSLALESDPVRTPRSVATLVSSTDAAAPGAPLRLGLRLRLAPGWHTYWANPGDAGVAPELSLSLPPSGVAGPIEWPTPLRLPEGPVMAYGYTGEVLLPVSVTPGPGPLQVQASATWLVCERICVPEEGSFRLDLPVGIPAPSAEAPLFAAAAARLPRPSPFAARIAGDGTLTLSGAGLSAATVADAWFFPATPGLLDQAAAQPVQAGEGEVRLRLVPGPDFPAAGPLSGVLVLRDRAGQEQALQLSAAPGGAAAAPLWQTVLLALLGGALLNLMPCVFPVLAMKAVSLARLSGAGRRAMRAQAGSYTAGVLVAFSVLGAVLLGLRAAGVAAGWGFQLQSPVFVAAMAWVLLLVGLNLSGVYAVGGRLAGAGQGLAGRGGHVGSFCTGLLAVLVASPCTAPFMGAAVAAALSAPWWAAAPVFPAMGLGMAAPYAALALLPGLSRALPRPGPWMEVLRGALAFPMYAAAAWLAWVLSQQAGPDGVLAALAGGVLVGLGAWAFGRAQASRGRGRGVGRAVSAGAALAAALLLLLGLRGAAPAPSMAGDGEPYSAARLAALRAEGRPVFVNMTASWCVTCLVNERLALSPARVRAAFAAGDVAYLKGDWTRGDPAVSAFLRGHERDGVPLYVLYRPGAPPAVLPQLLREQTVLDALEGRGG